MPFFPIWVHCLLPFKGRLPPSSLSHLCLQPRGHWYRPETQRCCSQHIKVSTWASLAEEQNRLVWDQQSLDSRALKSKLRIFLPVSLWCMKQSLTPKVDPGLDLSPTGVWLLSSVRWLQLCLSKPPQGLGNEGAKGAFDLEQLVTAHLQQALQVVLIIKPPKRVYRDEQRWN